MISSRFHQLLRVKHGPFRDFLDEVVGDFLAEVEGFEGPGAGVGVGMLFGGVDAGMEALDLGEAAAAALAGDRVRAAFEDGVHDGGALGEALALGLEADAIEGGDGGGNDGGDEDEQGSGYGGMAFPVFADHVGELGGDQQDVHADYGDDGDVEGFSPTFEEAAEALHGGLVGAVVGSLGKDPEFPDLIEGVGGVDVQDLDRDGGGIFAWDFGVFGELCGGDAADDGIEKPIDGALADDPRGVLGRGGGGRLEAADEGQVVEGAESLRDVAVIHGAVIPLAMDGRMGAAEDEDDDPKLERGEGEQDGEHPRGEVGRLFGRIGGRLGDMRNVRRALDPLGELGGGFPHENQTPCGEQDGGDGEQVIEEIGAAIEAGVAAAEFGGPVAPRGKRGGGRAGGSLGLRGLEAIEEFDPEPFPDGLAGRCGFDGVAAGLGGGMVEELVHQAEPVAGAGSAGGVFRTLGIGGDLGDPGGEGFLPAGGNAAVVGEHGEQVVTGFDEKDFAGVGMDEDNGEFEIEGGADGFQGAAGFSAEVGIDDRDEDVGLPEEESGLAAVSAGASAVGEVEAVGGRGRFFGLVVDAIGDDDVGAGGELLVEVGEEIGVAAGAVVGDGERDDGGEVLFQSRHD